MKGTFDADIKRAIALQKQQATTTKMGGKPSPSSKGKPMKSIGMRKPSKAEEVAEGEFPMRGGR